MRYAASSNMDNGRFFAALVGSVLLIAARAAPQNAQLPQFMGRDLTITTPPLDADGNSPQGPASVCVGGPPARHCYTAPQEFGKDPKVDMVQIEKDKLALFFSAASGGVSGWNVHFALLRPGTGNDLDELLDASVSNQNQYAFWDAPALSEAKIFVTADFVWGPAEGHYDPHRFIISAYVLKRTLGGRMVYALEDRYMTARKYSQDANDDILGAEKPEILSRLAHVKAEAGRGPGRQ